MGSELLNWKKQALDGEVARAVRHDTRMHRRERGRGGHRFRFDDLKALWHVGDYVVLTHHSDSIWQLYHRDPEQGWLLISWFFTRREAQVAALHPLPDITPKPKRAVEGVHVLAGWPDGEKTMRVPCGTSYTAEVIEAAFASIGCETERELVTT